MTTAGGFQTRKIAWSIDAEARLLECMTQREDMEIVRAEVMSGASSLFEVNGDSLAILRRENSELVVVCYAGRELRAFADAIIQHAFSTGFSSIRWHTSNPAIVRMLRYITAEPVEYVMRIKKDGR